MKIIILLLVMSPKPRGRGGCYKFHFGYVLNENNYAKPNLNKNKLKTNNSKIGCPCDTKFNEIFCKWIYPSKAIVTC